MKASIIILTRNEASGIEACVDACIEEANLARLGAEDAEIIVIDSDSTDDTVARVRARVREDERIRLVACHRVLPFGEARNLGVRAARGEAILFISADAEPAVGWLGRALEDLATFDIVYGYQEHAPPAYTVATVSRGLRYHVFDAQPPLPPRTYASNVNAAYRRTALATLRFDDHAGAIEDALLARAAEAEGLAIAYDPALIVRHRDVADLRSERRKLRREGRALGEHVALVGLNAGILGWGLAALLSAALLVAAPNVVTGLLFPAVVWAPGVRRLRKRNLRYPTAPAIGALLLAPAFDALFLVSYLQGLGKAKGWPRSSQTTRAQRA
jgi:glycosyltransferase involved in cell wall biosynthesis